MPGTQWMHSKYQLLASSGDKDHSIVQAKQKTLAGWLLFGAICVVHFSVIHLILSLSPYQDF